MAGTGVVSEDDEDFEESCGIMALLDADPGSNDEEARADFDQ